MKPIRAKVTLTQAEVKQIICEYLSKVTGSVESAELYCNPHADTGDQVLFEAVVSLKEQPTITLPLRPAPTPQRPWPHTTPFGTLVRK